MRESEHTRQLGYEKKGRKNGYQRPKLKFHCMLWLLCNIILSETENKDQIHPIEAITLLKYALHLKL